MLALLVAPGLAGCASISEKIGQTIADVPGIGLPEGVPDRPVVPASYPAVHDMPPARSAVLTAEEQIAMENELVKARERQQTLASQPAGEPDAEPAQQSAPPPARSAAPRRGAPPAGNPNDPTSSSAKIY